MEAVTIKLKTIQFINGIKYLSEKQAQEVMYTVCHNLGIEKNENNLKVVKEGIKTYFDLQNQFGIV